MCLSAYTVESFTIRRMTMVRVLRQLVCESPVEDVAVSYVLPDMWHCLTDWFFSYKCGLTFSSPCFFLVFQSTRVGLGTAGGPSHFCSSSFFLSSDAVT